MASGGEIPVNLKTTLNFVKLTASKFEWGDLSEDTVMDIGCGRDLYCAKAILENFPKVKSIIALDGSQAQIRAISFQSPKIQPFLADILNRNNISLYEGKIDKAISTHVIHQIPDKQKVFENVYRLLKPEGQAAFLFTSDLGLFHVLENLRLDSKYKDYYKGGDVMALYSSQFKVHHYREMLEKIGFTVIEIIEEKDSFSRDVFGHFENTLHKSVRENFSVPPELVEEINNSACDIYQAYFCDNKSVYAATEMSIFVSKPSDSSTCCSSS